MSISPKRYSVFREKAYLTAALLLFLLVLSLCTVRLYQLFDKFDTAKRSLRQTQHHIDELTALEGRLGQTENKFRTYLLTGNNSWLANLEAERIGFRKATQTLQQQADLRRPMERLQRLMDQKTAIQDRILRTLIPAKDDRRFHSVAVDAAIFDSLVANSADMRLIIAGALNSRQQILRSHLSEQDRLQPRIIWQVAAISGVVALLLLFLFGMTYSNLVRRARALSQMQLLLGSTHDGFYLLDSQWNIVMMNQKAKLYLDAGSHGNSALGQNLPSLFPEPIRSDMIAIYRRILEGEIVVYKQDLVLEGKPCIIELQHKATLGSSGKPNGLTILVRDITEQELAETARRRSEQTRRLIMDAAQDAIVCIDRRGNISYWNNKAEQIFGWTESEALGKPLSSTIIPHHHRQGHDGGFRRYRNTGEHHVLNKLLELTAIDKTGREFPVELFILELKGDHEEFICAYIRDISERKKSDNERNKLLERLRFTNDMVQLGTWQFNSDTQTLVCDEVVYALLELPTHQVLDRYNWMDYIHPEDRKAVAAQLAVFVAEKPEMELYFRVITPAGATKFLYQKAVKNMDAEGRLQEVVGGVIDITQLKKAEATFRQVVNASPNALLLVNKKGAIVLANQQAEELFGYPEQELRQQNIERMVPIQVTAMHRQMRESYHQHPLNRPMASGRELFATRHDGTEIPVEVGLSSVELEGEQLVLASVVDISQRKAAEAERQDLLTRFKLAADATQLGIWDFDLETGQLLWNEHMYDMASVPRNTDISFEQWRGLVHPDDLEETLRNFQQAVEQARPNFGMEYRIVLPNGEIKILTQRAITFCNNDGKVVRCLGTSQDVTLQRQSEAIREELLTRFELAAETLHLGILDADLRTGAVQGDAQLKLMLGIEAIPNPDWRVWIRQVYPDDRAAMQALLLKALPQGSLLEAEWRQERDSGELRHFETKARIIWKNGQPSRLIAATIDITERVNQRNELISAKLQAEKSEQLQEQFLANMSHEIRTPLNGIVGMSDLMGGTLLTARQREYLQVIQNSSQGLLTIINDVLDISKIKAGKFTIDHAAFNLHHVIISAFELLQLKATQKSLSYQLQVDPDVPVMVMGDAGRLSQVLINLLGNAVKFTREGSVVLTVHPAGYIQGKMRLLFTVTDTGIGMSPEVKDDVFNSFAQASREVGIEFGGTGLGLAISKQLVELQGGSIEVESTLGLGSCFRILLAYEVVDMPQVLPEEGPRNLPNELYSGKRVLVAEDNEVNRMVIAEYLQKVGLTPVMTHDGQQAVDMLQQDPAFDLVILDLRMPVLNGFETAQAIRQQLKLSMPIMALSASTLRSEKDKCLSVGMNAYMAKPFKASELYNNIYQLISGASLAEAEKETPEAAEELPLYDLSELEMLGEPDFARQIIDTFIQNGGSTMREIDLALAAGKTATVFELAHRLKSSSGMLGAQALMQSLAKTEALARTSPASLDELTCLVAQTQALFEQVSTALERGKAEIDNWPAAGN